MTQIRKLGELESNSSHPVYRRSDGMTWMKLNATTQCQARKQGGNWTVASALVGIDSNEEVEVIHFAHEKVA